MFWYEVLKIGSRWSKLVEDIAILIGCYRYNFTRLRMFSTDRIRVAA